jgi:hopanoid biosynthesis associated RND transporter like protein HpnN
MVRFVDAMCRRPIMVVLLSGLIAVFSTYAFCTKTEYFTRRSDLASPDKDYQRRWRAFVSEFGDEDDLVVVVRGGDTAQKKSVVDDLAQSVATKPELFDRLFYRADLTVLKNRALLYLPTDQLQAVRENLDRMAPLLSAPVGPLAWRSLTLTNLLRQARERAGRIDPDSPLTPVDEQFLTQLLATVQSANASLTDPAGYRNPWGSLMPTKPDERSEMLDRPQYLTNADGSLMFLLTRPVKEADSFTPAQASVEALREIVNAAKPRYPELEIGVTGLPALETDEMVASQSDSNVAGWLALGGTALLYWLVYRGYRYPLLTVTQLLVGTAWAMGWLTLTVGHLNILSSAFAVMLIGLGDYGVLWITHYEQLRRAGEDPVTATRGTAAEVGPSLFTACSATALAFFVTMLADFRAIAELGWIAGCGVMFCCLTCFTVLPALIRLTDRRGLLAPLAVIDADGESRPVYAPVPAETAWLPALARRPRFVLTCLAVVTMISIGCGWRVRYDHNLLNMQADGLESVKWERELIANTAGASWHACSVCATSEDVLALKARYEQLPGVSRVVEVASLVPADQEKKLPLVADVHRRLGHLPVIDQPIEPFTTPAREARKEATLLIGALKPQAPISRQPVLRELVASLEQLRDHSVFARPTEAQTRLHEFERRLAADLIADLHRLREVSTPEPISLANLPQPLHERYVGAAGKFLVEAYAKEDLWDMAPLERFVNQIRAVDPEATGKPFGTLEGLKSMQHGFAWAGVYALFVIVAVLAIDFRSVKHTLIALMPLAFGVIWLLGVMALTGHNLNPANMIALPLIVGCGVDNGVHVLHDYRARRRSRYTLAATTGKGIAVSALTTVLGFGALMISSHKGLSGLGFVLALGVTTCMTAALVFLPAFLRVASEQRESRREMRAAA